METRICKTCNEEKKIEEYPTYGKKKFYRRSCIICVKESKKKYFPRYKEKQAIAQKECRKNPETREHVLKREKAWRDRNKENIAQTQKRHNAKECNSEKKAIRRKKWRAENPEKMREYGVQAYRRGKENLTDGHIIMMIRLKTKGILTRKVLEENPEEFELLKNLYILKRTLNQA
jgi:hypothetical protein